MTPYRWHVRMAVHMTVAMTRQWQYNSITQLIAHNSNIEDNIRVEKGTTFYFTRHVYQRLLGIVIERFLAIGVWPTNNGLSSLLFVSVHVIWKLLWKFTINDWSARCRRLHGNRFYVWAGSITHGDEQPKQINLSINRVSINDFINTLYVLFHFRYQVGGFSLRLGIKREPTGCSLQPATCSRHIRTRPIEIVNIIRLTDWPWKRAGAAHRTKAAQHA